MTTDQALVILGRCQSLWPEAVGFGSSAVQGTWCSELHRFDYAIVEATVRRLGRELSRPPALADVISDAKHALGASDALRITAPVRQRSQEEIAAEIASMEADWQRELEEFGAKVGWSEAETASRVADMLRRPVAR